jgi:hypothetical protein
MGLEDRVKRYFKREKESFYRAWGNMPAGDAFNSVWLEVARKFQIPVRQVKDIVNPGGHFGGWE